MVIFISWFLSHQNALAWSFFWTRMFFSLAKTGGNDLNMVGYTAVVEALSLEGNVALGAWGYTMGSWAAKVRVQAFPKSEMYQPSCTSESLFIDAGSVRDGRTEKLLPTADRHRTSILCTLHRGGQNVTFSGCVLYNSHRVLLIIHYWIADWLCFCATFWQWLQCGGHGNVCPPGARQPGLRHNREKVLGD